MAATAGKDVLQKVASTAVSGFSDSSCDVDVQNAEITSFGDAAVRRITGLADTSMSFGGYADYADAGQKVLIDAGLSGAATGAVKFGVTAASGISQPCVFVDKVSFKAKSDATPVSVDISVIAASGAPTWATV